MSFYDEIDGDGLIENEFQDLIGVEEQESVKILSLYKKVAGIIRRRLHLVKSGSFSEEKMSQVLFEIEQGLGFLTADLTSVVGDTVQSITGISTEHLKEELTHLNKKYTGSSRPFNFDTHRVAAQAKNYLFNRYEVSIRTYSDSLRQKMAAGLGEMVVERVGWDEMVGRMMGFFGGEEWRLRRITRTELHNIYGGAKLYGMRDLQAGMFPDLMKTLYHPMDSRTGDDSEYAASKNLIVKIDEPFRYEWPPGSGKWRIFMAPPDRPNDRSILIPYRPGWESNVTTGNRK